MDAPLEFSVSLNVDEQLESMIYKSVEAEHGGLDQVWIGDLPDQRYPAIVAGGIAENTSRIRVGLGPLSPFLYPAEHISSMLVALCEAYGSRFDLCLVPGDRSRLKDLRAEYGKNFVSKMLEFLKVIRNRLSKRGVEAKIWLGAQGPKMLKASTEFEGVLINLSSPDMVRTMLNESSISLYKKENFRIGVFFPSYVYRRYDLDIHRKAREAATRVILGASKALIRRYDLLDSVEDLRKSSKRPSSKEDHKSTPPNVLEKFYVSTPAQNLRGHIEMLREIGVSHFAFAFPQNSSVELVKDLTYAVGLIKHTRI